MQLEEADHADQDSDGLAAARGRNQDVRDVVAPGEQVICPVCGGRFPEFLPYGIRQRPNHRSSCGAF